MRRLVQLQIPAFVRIAETEPRLDRLQAVRDALHNAATWSRIVRFREKNSQIDPSPIPGLAEQQEAAFFREVLTRCEAALKDQFSSDSQLPFPAFEPWDYVSASLVFHFQQHIAELNVCLSHEAGWWEDRVDTYLDRLTGWARIHRHDRQLGDRAKAANTCIDVDQAWTFAVLEVENLSGINKEALVLPDKTSLIAQILNRALAITKPSRRSRRREHNGTK